MIVTVKQQWEPSNSPEKLPNWPHDCLKKNKNKENEKNLETSTGDIQTVPGSLFSREFLSEWHPVEG